MKEQGSHYPYVMLIATTVMAMIIIGGLSSFSILYKELLDFYNTRAGDTAIISSLCIFLNFAIGSFRLVMIVGGFLGFLGLFLSAFVSQMELWILTYGVISGLGFGLVYSPCFTVINFYFERRRALAIGTVLLGTGIGSVVFPFVFQSLIAYYGLRGAVLVISALTLNICVCAALIRQPKELSHRKTSLHQKTNSEDESQEMKNKTNHDEKKQTCFNCHVCKPKRPLFHFSLLRIPSFLIYSIGFMCSIFAYFSNFVLIPGHARVQGMDSEDIAVFLSVVGGMMVLARPAVGILADSNLIHKRNIIGAFVAVGGILSIILPWMPGFFPLIIYSVSVGIFPGSFFMFIPLLLLEITTLDNLPQAQGLMNLCIALPVGISQPAAGWLRDLTGNWCWSFRVSGAVSLLAGVCFVLEPAFRPKKCLKENQTVSSESAQLENL
uniref:Monocarboxylate transporter 12-like isoform X2 n=1 Tax=Crassostrea virginica TaxID=6565 RepID=A0A8B8D2K2_CRAVI|nr:monocarboxylate transporter 12-like isoform X2 [Crassostrea virginica]